ncbi:hypothetical protein LCGC14_0711550 [marine sediment metagenome]|uniref:Uncharacterized protein n=1 Tax=marine sediment metagenome TaxID=412755 RepID=A0A0F9QEV4_9ZZZZ
MTPKKITLTALALVRNGISVAETMSGSGDMAITGAYATDGVGILDIPRHIGIYAAGNESGKTFTVYGTDRNGAVISESITGPNATTVNGSKNFKTVTRVAVDAATAGDVEVGTTNQFDSQIVPVDSYKDNISYNVSLSSDKDLTYEFEYTLSDILASGFVEADAVWFSDLGPKTVNSVSGSITPFRACRLVITNYVAGTITWNIVTART